MVYDSLYGNTEKVAYEVARILQTKMETKVVRVSEADEELKKKIDALIVGSPTQGGRPKIETQQWLERIPKRRLMDVKCAAFDTRFLESEQSYGLKMLMKLIGYAAPKMIKMLKDKGGEAIDSGKGFIVTAKEGPLAEGELQEVQQWTENLIVRLK